MKPFSATIEYYQQVKEKACNVCHSFLSKACTSEFVVEGFSYFLSCLEKLLKVLCFYYNYLFKVSSINVTIANKKVTFTANVTFKFNS